MLDDVSAFQGDKYESGRSSLLVWPGLPRSLTGAGLGLRDEVSPLFTDG